MRTIILNALGAAVCAIAVGCGGLRQVTNTSVLQSASVDCHWRRVIWESSDTEHGCDVTVTYRGTDTCPARLLAVGIRGGYPATDPAGPAGRTVKLHDVQLVWLACGTPTGEPHSDGCSYTIDRVNCSHNAAELETTTLNTAALTNVTVACGAPARTVWATARAGLTGCNVTVRLRGTDSCPGILEFTDATGNDHSISTPSAGDLVTLINVKTIRLRCGDAGSAGSGQCACDVVQVDCPK